MSVELQPGPRIGRVTAPPSKSHEHRLLIASFLAGERDCLADAASDSADILATKRCLRALIHEGTGPLSPVLDCGESGSTLRFLAPVAAALGMRPRFIRRGRLAERPFKSYDSLESGVFELPGDVSSQFVTGLLFALPLLNGDSRIRFVSPLESRGYVDMTLRVVRDAGIVVEELADGYCVPGGQTFRSQATPVEGDWSGAAFWIAMNALGSSVKVDGLREDSLQPDRAILHLCADMPSRIDVSQYPDIFPVLAVVASSRPSRTVFTGIRRLRLKECDRVAAMEETLRKLGAGVSVADETFAVDGVPVPFASGEFRTFGDHRIAMSVAVAATRASGSLFIDNAECAAKSYPQFFDLFGTTL